MDPKRIESSYRGRKYVIIKHDFEESWCLFIGNERRGYYDNPEDAHNAAFKMIRETALDRLLGRLVRTWKAARREWELDNISKRNFR